MFIKPINIKLNNIWSTPIGILLLLLIKHITIFCFTIFTSKKIKTTKKLEVQRIKLINLVIKDSWESESTGV